MFCGCGIFCQRNEFWHWPTDLLQEPTLCAGKHHRQVSEVSFSWKGNPDVWKIHYVSLIYSFCLAIVFFKCNSSEEDVKDVKKGTSPKRAAHFHLVLLKGCGRSKLLLGTSLSRCWNIYNRFQTANVTRAPSLVIFCLAWPFRQAQAETLAVVSAFPLSFSLLRNMAAISFFQIYFSEAEVSALQRSKFLPCLNSGASWL